MKAEQPITIPIKDFVDEAEGIRTFFFDHNINSKPGQFFLLWIPGLNEKPFGVASENKNGFSTWAMALCREALTKMQNW